MRLRRVSAKNFRTYDQLDLSFTDGINLITGRNGIGKTNILEAIHYLCLTKSFASARDAACLKQDSSAFVVQGEFVSDSNREYSVVLRYARDTGKRLTVNKVEPERQSEHVGRFPIVVFSPDDYALTADGPEERRRYLDNILSQAYSAYLSDSMAFRQTLRQRNSLLQAYPRPPGFAASLEAWTSELVRYGARIIARRYSDISLINNYLQSAFSYLDLPGEHPEMSYKSGLGLPQNASLSIDEIEARYHVVLENTREKEISRRRTLTGPHRDELDLSINARPLRNFASQGQHRTFAMALKIAQFMYLQDVADETPVLLLDDAFDHLDPYRIERYVRMVSEQLRSQTFITTASSQVLDQCIDYSIPKNSRHDLEDIDVGSLLRNK